MTVAKTAARQTTEKRQVPGKQPPIAVSTTLNIAKTERRNVNEKYLQSTGK
jgi:hypothetical protein